MLADQTPSLVSVLVILLIPAVVLAIVIVLFVKKV
jgi:hypothetical protein